MKRRIDCHILIAREREDSALRILEQLSKEPINLVAFPARLGALTDARIDAMRCGRAEFICWVDDDDSITPGVFSRLQAELDAHPEACGVFSSEAHVVNGQVTRVVPRPGLEWSLDNMIHHHPLVHHVALFRRSWAEPHFETIKQFQRVGDQLLLWLLAKDGPWVHVPIVGYHWNRDGQQITKEPGIAKELASAREYFLNT